MATESDASEDKGRMELLVATRSAGKGLNNLAVALGYSDGTSG